MDRLLPPADAPLFFGAAMKDWVCVASLGYAVMRDKAFEKHDVTIRQFESDHWVLFSVPDEVCRAIEDWIEHSLPDMRSSVCEFMCNIGDVRSLMRTTGTCQQTLNA